jgi:YidC/Oxa1 family membrane protein insertase
MDSDNNRNFFLLIAIAAGILMFYQFFVWGPQAKRIQAQQAAQRAAASAQQPTAAANPAAPPTGFLTPAQALGKSPRVAIATPTLAGSIALKGAVIDDLSLIRYREQVDPKSPPVKLMRPQGSEGAFYAVFGWTGANVPGLPDTGTLWTAPAGAQLTPTTPLVLTYENGAGLKFTRTIAVDGNYMFTVADTVANTGAQPVSLQPAATIWQVGTPADFQVDGKGKGHPTSGLVHEGGVGVIDGQLKLPSFTCSFGQLFCQAWKPGQPVEQSGTGGWLGITQKYWLAAIVPDQSMPVKTGYRVTSQANGPDLFDADLTGAPVTIPAGQQVTKTQHLFVGPKSVPLINSYAASLHIPRFDQAVDWGVYWFFTRPIFAGLEFFNGYLPNLGLAILALTVVIRLALFPLANKSYESMSKMRKIQPQVEALKKQFGDDQTKLQQETMALYQREKINPLMGCLPLLIQIPLLYSLYKVLTVTIEMRHAPFYGWIHDLSARDPTTVWNLFGLIPWDPAHAPLIGGLLDTSLHIGVLPLVYGFTMWLSTSMSPPPPDPTQKMMMQFLPFIFTFTLAQFTVGLLIYWTWSNVITILQQYVMMHRFQVENPIDDLIARFARPKPKPSG